MSSGSSMVSCAICFRRFAYQGDLVCSKECLEIREKKRIPKWELGLAKKSMRLKKRKKILELEVKNLHLKIREMSKDRRVKKQFKVRDGFYESRRWQELRYEALRRNGRVCVLCKAMNIELHVDHIRPRSKYPDLELDISNLQVLCRPCNLGKSNKDETDWREVNKNTYVNR